MMHDPRYCHRGEPSVLRQAQEAAAEEEEEADADGGTSSSAAGAAEAAAMPAEEAAAGVANGDVQMADAPAALVSFSSCASPAHCCQCCKVHRLGMRHEIRRPSP